MQITVSLIYFSSLPKRFLFPSLIPEYVEQKQMFWNSFGCSKLIHIPKRVIGTLRAGTSENFVEEAPKCVGNPIRIPAQSVTADEEIHPRISESLRDRKP